MKHALLTLALGAMLLAPAAAQSPSPAPSTNPHARPNRPAGGQQGGPMGRFKSELNLSDAQAKQLQPLLRSFMQKNRERMQARQENLKRVLTPDQLAQLQQLRQQHGQGADQQGPQNGGPPPSNNQGGKNGPHKGGPMSQLNLTQDQKEQLKTFNQQSMQEAQADRSALFAQTKMFLNADQESKLESMLERPHPPRQGGGRPNQQQQQQ